VDFVHRIKIKYKWLKWRSVFGVLGDHRITPGVEGGFYKTAIVLANLCRPECCARKKQRDQ